MDATHSASAADLRAREIEARRHLLRSGALRKARAPRPMLVFAGWPIPEGSVDLWVWQAGRCAMCASEPDGLVLDHDHDTWKVRGYLCRSCNQIEAHSEAWFWVAWRAGMNAAARLGIDEDYYFGPKPEVPVLTDERLRRAMLAAS